MLTIGGGGGCIGGGSGGGGPIFNDNIEMNWEKNIFVNIVQVIHIV